MFARYLIVGGGFSLNGLIATEIGKVLVLGSVPTYRATLPEEYFRAFRQGSTAVNWIQLATRDDFLRWDFNTRDAAIRAGGSFISIYDRLCHDGMCRTFVPESRNLMQFDTQHLSLPGAQYVAASMVGPFIDKLKAAAQR